MAWLPRILFALCLVLAAALAGTVVVAPWVGPRESADLGDRVWNLFATDRVVRRTALACALGLLVTACVFFRPPNLFRRMLRRSKSDKHPPPGTIAGA